jgi:16S rRNA (cytidine1402-2'-O)-methyltransferase
LNCRSMPMPQSLGRRSSLYHATMSGTLVLCATPIGNLGDVSSRLRDALDSADVIFAEDTRRTGQLLSHLGVSTPMRSYFAGNERVRNEELRGRLVDGNTVAFVSDAGMPVVSDPGFSAVNVAVECEATVTAVPGPSAPVTAIAISGFTGDRFVFDGFLPRKGHDRVAAIASIASQPRPTVLFAATRRVASDLNDLASALDPERRVVIARELTKLHEQVWRGTLVDAAIHWASIEPRGEFTLVIEGASAEMPDLDSATEMAVKRIDDGTSMSEAVKEVAGATGVSRRELYDAVLNAPS